MTSTFDSNNHGDEHHTTSVMSDNHYDTNSQNTSKPEDERKLFVGGLTWDTTSDDLREYFSKFGQILDCSIKHDPTTGRSRGFAFLVFDRKEIVEKILSHNEHFVKGRKVDPKPAHRRLTQNNLQHPLSSSHPHVNNNNHPSTNNNRKVFIGGVDPNFPDVQLREYFSRFGVIEEIDLPYDKEKNERRPFCFISFQNEQSAQEVLRIQKHSIGDVTVDVKRAKPKTSNNQGQQQQLYDPYGQQNLYASYGSAVSSYGSSGYSTNDPYAPWNAYSYNQQVNSTGYAYNGNGATNSATSNYSQYAQHPINSQYSYGPTNTIGVNEYYSQYGYGSGANATQANSNVYAEPNAYGVSGFEYNQYLASMGTNANGAMGDNGVGQQGDTNSSNDKTNYDHDNRYGLNKATMVANSNYQSYPIT